MKKLISMMMVAAATLALASCGGGTGSGPLTGGGGGGTGTPPPPTQYNLTVLTSSPQMPSDGSKSPTITALVRDTNNNVVSGVPVSFQASSGALAVTTGTTGSDGTATATLSTAGDPTNRDVKVTADAGASTASVDVSVIGTKLSLSGPTSLVIGSQGSYDISLTDSGSNGISGQTVTVASAKDNTINPATLTTDASGHASFTVTAVNSGTDTLTASAGQLQATQDVAVSSDSFTFTSPQANQIIDLGSSVTVQVVWTSGGVAQTNKPVQFSATRGTLTATSGTTDGNGSASVSISSTEAGPSVITATSSGVSAQVIVDFVATAAAKMSVQASPANVPTQGQSTITATVRDTNNNLVEGQTVDFQLQDSTGGTLSVGSAKTNVQGQATTVYTASTTSSATNGVVVVGTVQGTPATGQATLTVGGQTVFLSLGTGNTIAALNSTQYEMPYSVQAIDSSGNGVNGVTVSFTVDSLGYLKGKRVWNTNTWTTVGSTAASDADLYLLAGVDGCLSEDLNQNGILDTNPNEDYNGNGKLDPGLVVSSDVSSAVTANGGTAAVNLIYPKDHAYWVAVRLTATATVNGTQSSTSQDFWLPGLAADFDSQNIQPPGPSSPYGQGTTCLDKN